MPSRETWIRAGRSVGGEEVRREPCWTESLAGSVFIRGRAVVAEDGTYVTSSLVRDGVVCPPQEWDRMGNHEIMGVRRRPWEQTEPPSQAH